MIKCIKLCVKNYSEIHWRWKWWKNLIKYLNKWNSSILMISFTDLLSTTRKIFNILSLFTAKTQRIDESFANSQFPSICQYHLSIMKISAFMKLSSFKMKHKRELFDTFTKIYDSKKFFTYWTFLRWHLNLHNGRRSILIDYKKKWKKNKIERKFNNKWWR